MRPSSINHSTCHAGTKPLPAALKSVATHFQRYPCVGALTGELTVQRPYRTFLTAVQFCEWKVSHLLQKPIESVCGFLTVLPGAFCAFRWAAVEVRGPGNLIRLACTYACSPPGMCCTPPTPVCNSKQTGRLLIPPAG